MSTCGCVLQLTFPEGSRNGFSHRNNMCKHLKIPYLYGDSANVLWNETRNKKAFICEYEEGCTVRLFLDALVRYEFEDARVYISKNFVTQFDLDELSDYFCSAYNYKLLGKEEFRKPPKNCVTNSIIVVEDQFDKRTSIIHLHMIKEPDIYGKWKIYGIDKE